MNETVQYFIHLFQALTVPATVADLGGCSRGQLPPLHYENSAWRPIFGKKGAPYPRPNALFSSRFVLDVGNM